MIRLNKLKQARKSHQRLINNYTNTNSSKHNKNSEYLLRTDYASGFVLSTLHINTLNQNMTLINRYTILAPILQIRKLRYQVIKSPAQNHRVNKGWCRPRDVCPPNIPIHLHCPDSFLIKVNHSLQRTCSSEYIT